MMAKEHSSNVPSRRQIRDALARHVEAFSGLDRDGWLANFTDEPELIEPADAPARYGREHFAEVIDRVIAAGRVVKLTPVLAIVNGNQVAAHIDVESITGGQVARSSVLEVFTIAEDGRVASIQAFMETADPSSPETWGDEGQRG